MSVAEASSQNGPSSRRPSKITFLASSARLGSEEAQYLPSIQDPGKWDNNMHGRKHSIHNDMNLVKI